MSRIPCPDRATMPAEIASLVDQLPSHGPVELLAQTPTFARDQTAAGAGKHHQRLSPRYPSWHRSGTRGAFRQRYDKTFRSPTSQIAACFIT
jgi:hypothetical protein